MHVLLNFAIFPSQIKTLFHKCCYHIQNGRHERKSRIRIRKNVKVKTFVKVYSIDCRILSFFFLSVVLYNNGKIRYVWESILNFILVSPWKTIGPFRWQHMLPHHPIRKHLKIGFDLNEILMDFGMHFWFFLSIFTMTYFEGCAMECFAI